MGKISDALKKISRVREEQKQTGVSTLPEPSDQQEDTTVSVATHNSAKVEPLTLTERWGLREKLFVVGEKDSSGIDPRVVTYYDYSSIVSEQYRNLRTSIKTALSKLNASSKTNMAKVGSKTDIFTITSALHSEGKTITAVNLAVALAHEFENKVLLVDCDLRKGSIHKLLNLKPEVGLSDVLAKHIDASGVITETKIRNLSVIPSGKSPFNASELLGSRKMRMIIERLKVQKFTHIILDTPPLLPFADGAILGAQTQGVFMVVQAGRTQTPEIEKAKIALEHAHSRFLGFILTQVDSFSSSAYGYNYYYYHSNRK